MHGGAQRPKPPRVSSSPRRRITVPWPIP